ncbi:MAG: DUF3137 domain-containing protein [Eubacterium sp.]|nr:DUF3137 domain-containing protein [Eubacterium sp.]
MGIHEGMTRLEAIRSRAELGICFVGIGIIVFFTTMAFFQSNTGMTIGLILGIFGVFYAKGTGKEYKRLYKQIFVEGPLRQNFDNTYYAPKTGLDANMVGKFQLCRMGNRFDSEDYVRASYKGINFEMSDVHVWHQSNAGRGKSNITYFRGRMIVFDFLGKNVSSTRVYSNTFGERSKEGAMESEKVEMESISFNHTFDVYAASPHDAFYLITPQFMEMLTDLQKKYQSIAVHIWGDKVVVGFNERTNDAFDKTDWLKKISYPEEMRKIQGDIDDIKRIIEMIDALNIDSRDQYSV